MLVGEAGEEAALEACSVWGLAFSRVVVGPSVGCGAPERAGVWRAGLPVPCPGSSGSSLFGLQFLAFRFPARRLPPFRFRCCVLARAGREL